VHSLVHKAHAQGWPGPYVHYIIVVYDRKFDEVSAKNIVYAPYTVYIIIYGSGQPYARADNVINAWHGTKDATSA